jgi:hypothetical protein
MVPDRGVHKTEDIELREGQMECMGHRDRGTREEGIDRQGSMDRWTDI